METLETTEPLVEELEGQELATGEDGGGLPSAQDENKALLDGFAITDEIQSKYFKNGKLMGRFDNVEDLILANKSVEDKYSQLMREIKSGKQDAPKVDLEPAVDTTTLVQPLVQEYVQNGMELTDDIIAKAVEQGLDVRDVKLAAIEIKEQINKAYEIVGGKSEYEAMIAWGKDNLNEKDKASFDKDLGSGMGEWAIRGLYAQYKEQGGKEATNSRITGDSGSGTGIKAYATVSDIIRDRNYINSVKGKSDIKAQEMYNRRMSVTPDNVIYGR